MLTCLPLSECITVCLSSPLPQYVSVVGVIRKKAAISIAYIIICKLTFFIALGEYLGVGQMLHV